PPPPPQVLELPQQQAADPAPLVAGVDRELLHEERPHLVLGEVALVHPVFAAGYPQRALGVADDLGFGLALPFEDQLLDPLFLVPLEEPPLRSRALVLDRL